jgi:hypothetical protein
MGTQTDMATDSDSAIGSNKKFQINPSSVETSN